MLALADRIPNADAVASSPTIGWLLLATAVAVALLFVLYADRWRRFWMTLEDPRGIAMFRIVFAFFVLANINGMWELFGLLYTDEGIFTADVARQLIARDQFAGFGDGLTADEPWGFFDLAAVWQFAKGPRWSLLYFWDSPAFFWTHLVAFEVAAICLMIGFRTRLMAVLTWFLMNSILERNHLAWEGTEIVYRCFLAYLVFARSGHAYSVDNWLRCRRLARRGETPVVHRPIPSWPRKLIMLQLAVIYLTTGLLKNGHVWMRGDALYYALNLDHFYRLPPQYLASVAGTTVLRAMTWAVKVGQILFPLVLVGIVARWAIREKLPPLSGAARWIARTSFATIIVLTAAITWVAWPVHFTPPIDRTAFAGMWIALWGGLWLLWRKLEHRPFVIRSIAGRSLGRTIVIDRVWVCRWIIGRRVLLVWHIAFHAHIFTLMNVGQFQTGMLSATFAFLEGPEIAALLRAIGHRLARWRLPFIPAAVARGEPALPPAELPPPRPSDAAIVPRWAMIVALVTVVAAIVVRVVAAPAWDFRWIWLSAAVFLAGVAWASVRRKPGPADAPAQVRWAYGPFGRFVLGLGLAFHLTAVATWLLPDKDCVSSFRPAARQVFTTWLTRTTTDQGWGMFAPNPPRQNVFLKVLVTDADGTVWDLQTDVYAESQKPIPWVWNTRVRKMNRRIIGGESGPTEWYRKWYARYECRQWAREHDGVAPRKVQLVKISYGIPSPEETRRRGYYVAEDLLARTGREQVSHTEHCATAVMGQLPDFIRARDGLPLLREGEYKPWVKHKRNAWERRHEHDKRR